MKLLIGEDTLTVREASEIEMEVIKSRCGKLQVNVYDRRKNTVLEAKGGTLFILLNVLACDFDIEII